MGRRRNVHLLFRAPDVLVRRWVCLTRCPGACQLYPKEGARDRVCRPGGCFFPYYGRSRMASEQISLPPCWDGNFSEKDLDTSTSAGLQQAGYSTFAVRMIFFLWLPDSLYCAFKLPNQHHLASFLSGLRAMLFGRVRVIGESAMETGTSASPQRRSRTQRRNGIV